MSALKDKIFEKMKEYTLASFATVTEDGKPWTRYVVVKADEELNMTGCAAQGLWLSIGDQVYVWLILKSVKGQTWT